MATYNRIDRDEFRQRVKEGMTVKELAQHFNVSISAIAKVKKELGMVRALRSHKEALPWTVAREHDKLAPVLYLRDMSTAIAGDPVPPYRLNTAARWARRIVEAGRDIAYDRERPIPDPETPDGQFCPDGGFYTVEWTGRPEDGHLGGLLARLAARGLGPK
ncbi:hypothetical protein [Acrocarpospora sp. B8E8]|uniref:hypothetical protein n=1 Tax=Acrocarpospora sp. B8E8 TaxID=3153572 RepID=UPI00325C9C48